MNALSLTSPQTQTEERSKTCRASSGCPDAWTNNPMPGHANLSPHDWNPTRWRRYFHVFFSFKVSKDKVETHESDAPKLMQSDLLAKHTSSQITTKKACCSHPFFRGLHHSDSYSFGGTETGPIISDNLPGGPPAVARERFPTRPTPLACSPSLGFF